MHMCNKKKTDAVNKDGRHAKGICVAMYQEAIKAKRTLNIVYWLSVGEGD